MAIATKNITTAAYLASEANFYRSREEVTVTMPSGGAVAGAVLGKITSSGKYVPHDAALSNGAQNAVAVLYEGSDETGDVQRTITARDSEVVAAHLTFKDAISEPNKTAALASLAGVGIVAR